MVQNSNQATTWLRRIALLALAVAFLFLALAMPTVFDARYDKTVDVEHIKQVADLTVLQGIAIRNVFALCEISFIAKVLAGLLLVTGALNGTLILLLRQKR
jgi:hypothetical protein